MVPAVLVNKESKASFLGMLKLQSSSLLREQEQTKVGILTPGIKARIHGRGAKVQSRQAKVAAISEGETQHGTRKTIEIVIGMELAMPTRIGQAIKAVIGTKPGTIRHGTLKKAEAGRQTSVARDQARDGLRSTTTEAPGGHRSTMTGAPRRVGTQKAGTQKART